MRANRTGRLRDEGKVAVCYDVGQRRVGSAVQDRALGIGHLDDHIGTLNVAHHVIRVGDERGRLFSACRVGHDYIAVPADRRPVGQRVHDVHNLAGLVARRDHRGHDGQIRGDVHGGFDAGRGLAGDVVDHHVLEGSRAGRNQICGNQRPDAAGVLDVVSAEDVGGNAAGIVTGQALQHDLLRGSGRVVDLLDLNRRQERRGVQGVDQVGRVQRFGIVDRSVKRRRERRHRSGHQDVVIGLGNRLEHHGGSVLMHVQRRGDPVALAVLPAVVGQRRAVDRNIRNRADQRDIPAAGRVAALAVKPDLEVIVAFRVADGQRRGLGDRVGNRRRIGVQPNIVVTIPVLSISIHIVGHHFFIIGFLPGIHREEVVLAKCYPVVRPGRHDIGTVNRRAGLIRVPVVINAIEQQILNAHRARSQVVRKPDIARKPKEREDKRRVVVVFVGIVDHVRSVQRGAPGRQAVVRRRILVIPVQPGNIKYCIIIVIAIPLEIDKVIRNCIPVQLIFLRNEVGGQHMARCVVREHVRALRLVVDLGRADIVAGQEVVVERADRLPQAETGFQRRASRTVVPVEECELVGSGAQVVHDPGTIQRGEQRREVVACLDAQLSGGYIEAHALSQFNPGDIPITIQRKRVVRDGEVHAAFNDAQHAALFVGVNHGAVGELIDVNAADGIIAVLVAVKRLTVRDRHAAGEAHERVVQVHECSRLRHGDDGGAGLLIDPQRFAQRNLVHAASQRADQLQFVADGAGVIGVAGGQGRHHLEDCGRHIEVEHAVRRGGKRRVFTAETEQEGV